MIFYLIQKFKFTFKNNNIDLINNSVPTIQLII